LRASELYHLLHRLDEFGLSAKDISFDLSKVVARSRKVSDQLSNGVKFLMKKHKIEVVAGEGKLEGGGKLLVAAEGKTEMLEAKNIIIATGARARALPGLEPDGKLVWTYREALLPDVMPKSLLVIGSGAIGIEFASFFRTLGAEVTVVEVLDRILPVEDAEISQLAEKSFKKQGMTILTGAKVERLEMLKDGVKATIATKDGKSETKEFHRAILAVGITGNIENIGLEKAGVKTEKGHIVIDEWCRTGVPGLFAIGDVAGAPWLAHKAMHEGVLCVEKIAGVSGVHPMDVTNIPGCTYSQPQVASVGLTEAKAKEQGRAVKVGRFPYMGNGKAIALGEPEGLVKTIFDAKTGELLGAHMIGAEVTELIQGYVIARTLETTEAELAETVFAHPTLSEMMHESVLDAYGRALHI
jgi:dihydrolipoamide dehydrogenase